MGWDLLFALLAGGSQAAAAWLGWRVTVHAPATQNARGRFEAAFLAVGAVGLLAIVATAYRASESQQRADRLEQRNTETLARVDANLQQLASALPHEAKRQPSARPNPEPSGRDAAAATPSMAVSANAVQPNSYAGAEPETEDERRALILFQLRNLWIASNDNISSEMMAGLEWPPEIWLNEKLAFYRQAWRVRTNGAYFETYDLK